MPTPTQKIPNLVLHTVNGETLNKAKEISLSGTR